MLPTMLNWVTNICKLKNAPWNAKVKAERGIENQMQIKLCFSVHVCLARLGKKMIDDILCSMPGAITACAIF